MKSRFLASTIFFMLLGLFSNNLFAQLTDPSSVEIYLSGDVGGYKTVTSSAREDTVGNAALWRVEWEAGSQEKDVTTYEISFPEGTITDEAELDDEGIRMTFYKQSDKSTLTNFVPAANISVVDNELGTDYSTSTRPSVLVTAHRSWSEGIDYTIDFVSGVYHSKSVTGTNAYDYDGTDDQGNMIITFTHSDFADSSFTDSTSFYVSNDAADSVYFNADIQGIVDGAYWSGGDSIIVLDRFGNYVRDFFDSNEDSLILSVADEGVGTFTSREIEIRWDATHATPISASVLDTVDDGDGNPIGILIHGLAAKFNTVTEEDAAGSLDSTLATGGELFQVVNADGADDWDARDVENDDNRHVPLFLGNTTSRAAGATKHPYTLGLKFNAGDDVEEGDTIDFTITLYSKDATRISYGTLAEVPSNQTVTIRRVLYPSAISSAIGTITLSMSEISLASDLNTYYNGLTLEDGGNTATVTIKDVFGDPFATETVGGSDMDVVVVELRYLDLVFYPADEDDDLYDEDEIGELYSWSINTTKTTELQDGGSFGGFTRPSTYFIETGVFVEDSLKGATTDADGEVDFGGAQYLGTTSHPIGEGIRVVFYAKETPTVRDSALITVEPSPPIAWDVTTFRTNLETAMDAGLVVEGSATEAELPIFALDTAYNKVTNMDLLYNAGFLADVDVSNGAEALAAINFLIDARDPLGYDLDTPADSILLDSLTLTGSAGRTGVTLAVVKADPSFIYDYDFERDDSSRLNLGATGANPMGLTLLYQGVNYRITMQHKRGVGPDPGNLGYDYTAADNDVSTDLGMFTLLLAAEIDSVEDVAASSDTAGAVTDIVVSFTVPAENGFGPRADSLVTISFIDLPAGAGIPSGITAADVECSVDGDEYWDAEAVTQGGTGLEDSIEVEVSVTATEGATYYIKIKDFVNPTMSDTTYGVTVTTGASPVTATNPAALSVTDAGFSGLQLLPPGYDALGEDSLNYFADVDVSDLDTLVVGTSYLFKVLLGDRWGNVIDMGAAGSRGLIFRGPDTTSEGRHTAVSQVFDAETVDGSGDNMYDSLWVSYDTLANDDDDIAYSIVDSILITPAVAGTYTVTVTDSADTNIISAEVTLVVRPTVTGFLTLVDSLGLLRVAQSTVLDTAFKVILRDTYGNLMPDSVVGYSLSYGAGTFVDSNGVAIDSTSTLSVAADANGQASATLKTGTTDSIVVEVDVPSNTAIDSVNFYVTTREVIIPGASEFVFSDPPDSLVQDTSAGVTITVVIRDNELVEKVYLRAITTANVRDTETNLFSLAAVSDTAMVDSVVLATPVDEVDTVYTVPKQDLSTQVVYALLAIDGSADVDSTWSDSGLYLISPLSGKQDLTAEATNVADLMRVVYLYLKPEGLVARDIDYLGLDIDLTGDFEFADITAVLDLWKGTDALLASAAEEENRSARVSLAYEAVDKANAFLSINLENQGNLYAAGFRVKYDVDKFVFGAVKLTERLEGIEVQFSNNETEGVYSVVVINLKGRPIASGSGAILTIPVSAVGDKFDGEGEISLLEAGFERGVTVDIDAGILSPKAILPKAFALSQNYPNPFNPSTTIAFDIPESKEVFVRLNVYNIRGQLVRTLVNETMNEGSYKIEWDAKDNNGRYTASGVYFYRIKAGEFSQTRKMVILK